MNDKISFHMNPITSISINNFQRYEPPNFLLRSIYLKNPWIIFNSSVALLHIICTEWCATETMTIQEAWRMHRSHFRSISWCYDGPVALLFSFFFRHSGLGVTQPRVAIQKLYRNAKIRFWFDKAKNDIFVRKLFSIQQLFLPFLCHFWFSIMGYNPDQI